MQRVTRSTAIASLPAPPASPGPPGYFTGGNPAGGIQATVPGYEWFNMVQEELFAFLTAAGLTPSLTDLSQVLRGARQVIGKNRAVIAATTTWTAPADVTRVYSRVWGGGGGGGYASGLGNFGRSGAGGGYAEGYVNVVPGTGYAATVGTGGTGGTSGTPTGGNGGTSAFAGVISCTGGTGGGTSGTGGTGGTATGGSINIPGMNGGVSSGSGATLQAAGGGPAFMGSITQPVSENNGNPGLTPGSGGSGGCCTTTAGPFVGGSGANGLIILDW